MTDHVLCCDCDECLGPGVKLDHEPRVFKVPGRPGASLKRRNNPSPPPILRERSGTPELFERSYSYGFAGGTGGFGS